MKRIRFLAYSDIHHDRKAARCITLDDTVNLESQIHHYIRDGGFDFSVFGGDRYLKREPEDEVKVRADVALLSARQGERAVPHFHLVGNHDWTKNDRGWHTSESLKYLMDSDQYLFVMDTPESITCGNAVIHSLPADVPFDMANYQVDPERFNLFIFHNVVRGSFIADNSDAVFQDGIAVSEIDRPEWDFVLGGDVHVPQQIPFRNTRGGYLGAVLQRTRADADQERGWLEVTATNNGSGWEVETEFKPTRNFFHRETWEVGPDTKFEDIRIDERYVDDQAVEVKLVGDRKDVDRVADDPKWANYTDIMMARSIEIIRDYKVQQKEAVVDLTSSTNAVDDLGIYLGSGFANIGNLNQDKIFEVLQRMLQEG